MRMDDRRKRSAADWLRTIGVAELAKALRELADEPDAEVIAERIVAERELKPIESTLDLARLVCRAKGLPERVPDDGPKAHPAARSFQALRMLVNDERSQLEELLRQLPYCLRPGGRAAFLTFHSGEENLVRKAVAEGRRAGLYAEGPSEPLKPDAAERRRNPRSAPARLHLFRRRAD